MTAVRIFKTDRPTLRFGRVLPMSKQDRTGWELLHARREITSKGKE